MTELENLSIDDVDKMTMALDAIDAARPVRNQSHGGDDLDDAINVIQAGRRMREGDDQ